VHLRPSEAGIVIAVILSSAAIGGLPDFARAAPLRLTPSLVAIAVAIGIDET
jgi:hypothetical protein